MSSQLSAYSPRLCRPLGQTGIVHCKDTNRPGRFGRTAFTFLGYTFRPRPARDRKGRTFLAFLPAISPHALKRISLQVRRWRLHRWIYHTCGEVARTITPIVAGCMQYYGRFYPSALYHLLALISAYLVRWIRSRYRRYDATRTARAKLAEITSGFPPPAPASALGHDRLLTRMTRAR